MQHGRHEDISHGLRVHVKTVGEMLVIVAITEPVARITDTVTLKGRDVERLCQWK